MTLGLILLASVLLVRPVSGPYRRMAGYADLFFMGAAFMLLETKNIVQYALLFGTTWFVNALVTAGVLLGAMIGGILEYLSLVVGYRWLLAVMALLYALAFITGRRPGAVRVRAA